MVNDNVCLSKKPLSIEADQFYHVIQSWAETVAASDDVLYFDFWGVSVFAQNIFFAPKIPHNCPLEKPLNFASLDQLLIFTAIFDGELNKYLGFLLE